MSESLAVQSEKPLAAMQLKAQVTLIQDVMQTVMKEGQHYGKIPGCGNRPALLKPGAEKLMMTFRLAADPQVQEIPTEDGITFRVVCRVTNQATALFLGAGIGECSSREEKYNWRSAICDEEYDATPDDRKRVKWAKKWENGKQKPYQIRQVRTNPADMANTILKMAKKRALVDAILTVTAASDIFAQHGEADGEEETGRRQRTSPGSSGQKDSGKPISEGAKKTLLAKATAKGVSEDDIRAAFELESINDIPTGRFNEVIAYIEKGVILTHEE